MLSRCRRSGWTPLHRAAEQGHSHLCTLLLDQGADVHARTAMGWFTPLHCCLAHGWVDTAELLVSGVN